MKKTNTFKRFAAITSASILAACMVAPMAMTSNAADITITGISTEVKHTFEVYQVFTGKLGADGATLSNLEWGSGVTAYKGTAVTTGDAVADTISAALTADGVTALDILGDLTLGTASKTSESTSETLVFQGLEDGYYVVKDVTNLDGKDDANSAWIVQVTGETGGASIAIKNETPTVDKQVWDEDTDDDKEEDANWGETADHAINESFQFKLVANVPANPNNAYYETYKVVFNDTYSTGVTYDGIASVKVGDTTLTSEQYSVDATTAGSLKVTINDIMIYDTNLVDGATVEVIYNAHLNENADVNAEGDTDTTNENTVYLQYSNNPDSTGTGTTGLGETEKDSVWVFTYKINNTKYKNSVAEGNKLENAGFKLYDSTGETEIGLIYDDTLKAYRLVKTGETAVEMKSAADGTFSIAGLDTGTYVLRETSTPDGYNTCADITVVISAEHKEDTDGIASTDLTASSNMSNDIINKAGSSLPETGGIGTTLFYLGGGAMVAVAGVYLISKKRMKNAD